ncbi:type II toxin-antitoxin system RelE family toxin [Kyrpidia spormannii]|uniref:Addiction module toxin RelE n=1 Tax=Kyrpidia spormannii TaxID=2055160 RepID=A0A6F9EI02_9BACL|nr:hypothetical protein [Kyrpidia spormannii]CAB3396047.1 conserved protein of unknown function [Kyrpidia spormannii]
MKRLDHPDFFDVDLPRIEAEMGGEARFEEFLACLDKAILEIMKNPGAQGAQLVRPPLSAYRKKKFNSTRKPPKGVGADFRLIYRYDAETDTLYVLGVGRRKPRDLDDVYRILNERVNEAGRPFSEGLHG